MTANVSNTANTSATQQAQLSSSISSQLENITKFLNINVNYINKGLKKCFYNQNIICNTMEARHLNFEQQVVSIKEQVARLRI